MSVCCLTVLWICVVIFVVSLPSGTLCYDGLPKTSSIQYDRQCLLHFAEAPLSRFKPPDLPDWVPTRNESKEPCPLRRRGKRGGIRQRVRKRGHRPPLPTITLANVRSIRNKLDELQANLRYDHEYRNCSIICLTETCLNPNIPSNTSKWPGLTF